MLEATTNPFAGRIIDPARLPDDPETFRGELAESRAVWAGEGVRVVWLSLPIALAHLVPPAAEAGFAFHHADPSQVTMTLSLIPGSYVPPYATHYIGAGGVVISGSDELLVIQERHHTRRHYKLPGGALHPGEHIADAVVREVKEETGIDTEFLHLVCFRHWHGYRHGKSDIYFVTRLRPLNHEIRPDEDEIAECFWMPVQDYLSHPDTHDFNRRIVEAALHMDAAAAAGHPVIAPELIPGYGSPQSHELFFPRQELST